LLGFPSGRHFEKGETTGDTTFRRKKKDLLKASRDDGDAERKDIWPKDF